MKKQSKITVLFRMIKLVRPLTGFMILAVFFGTMGFLTAEFIPILGGAAVVKALGGDILLSLKTIFIALPVLAILRAVFRLSEQRTNHYIAFTLLAIIRDKVFRALRKLCPAKLEGRDKGDLISLITSDVELLEVFYAHTISPICIAIVTELLMCFFIGSFHPILGVVALISYLCVGVILPLIISKRSGTMGDELRAMSGELSAHMLENIRNIDDTMQYSYGDVRLKEISEKTEELSRKQGLLSKLTGTNMALANTMIMISDIVMLAVCTILYQSGKIDFTGFLIPLIALMSSFGPVTALAALGTTLQSTVASGTRVLSVIDEIPVTEDITGKEKTEFNGAEVKNVTFSYENTNAKTDDESSYKLEVLKDVSLNADSNRIIGIVGKSGCGKSTLLKLLMRFWKVKEGEIFISGKSIPIIYAKWKVI